MDGSVGDTMTTVEALVVAYGLSVIFAIVILIVGRIIAGWARSAVQAGCRRSGKVDETLTKFFGNLIYYVVIAFTVIAVLSKFGIQTASLIAIFGAAGLAIGLALQGTLSNVAAGVMLLLFRPFKVGDYVQVAGVAGTVKEITLFTTELATPDNVMILAPNGQVWGSVVTNYSTHPTRRVDFVFGIAYGDDIGKAMESIKSVLSGDTRLLADPEPMIVVSNLGDNSVDLTVRVWANAGDYWGIKFDLTRQVKERFDADGISIPFPQRDVHLINAEA